MVKTHDDFVKLTKDVREMQKKYFKTKNQDVLFASKKLEQELDHAIKEHEEGKKPKLF